MNKDFELRYTENKLVAGLIDRTGESSEMVISGYAAIFNRLSHDLGGFKEIIAPGAFDSVLDDDVRAVFNHDPNLILGRSGKGISTLSLRIDENGLFYTVILPNNSIGKDVYESVKRGDIQESSFRFRIAPNGEEWKETPDGLIRTILKVSMLADVSPVTFPAYPDATVAARNLECWKDSLNRMDEIREKMHKLNEAKLDSF